MISRAESIAVAVQEKIESGELTAGARLLPIRVAARAYGVSKNTVVDAYDRLVASGQIDARRGSGFYVAHRRIRRAQPRPEHFAEAVDLVSLLREQLDRRFSVRAGDGRPPASWVQSPEVNRYLARGKVGDADRFEYGRPQGFTPLRETLAQTLSDRSIRVSTEQILFTNGANHAFDLLIRHLVKAGDPVLVETPGYYPLFGKLRLHEAEIVGVERGINGPDLDQLERKAKESEARLFFVQPLAHNPTGTSMDLATMHRLLKIAERHDLVIIEDDPFGDILPRATPHLAALDGLERVVYLGTFSKTLAPSLRCGYIAANQQLIASLTDIKMLTVVNTSGTIERMIHDVIVSGRYRRHLMRLRKKVERAGVVAVEKLRSIGLDAWQPTGGYYLWVLLPPWLDDLELARRAADRSIFLAPGSLFTPLPDQRAYALRVNVAHAADARLLTFLGQAVAQCPPPGG